MITKIIADNENLNPVLVKSSGREMGAKALAKKVLKQEREQVREYGRRSEVYSVYIRKSGTNECGKEAGRLKAEKSIIYVRLKVDGKVRS